MEPLKCIEEAFSELEKLDTPGFGNKLSAALTYLRLYESRQGPEDLKSMHGPVSFMAEVYREKSFEDFSHPHTTILYLLKKECLGLEGALERGPEALPEMKIHLSRISILREGIRPVKNLYAKILESYS